MLLPGRQTQTGWVEINRKTINLLPKEIITIITIIVTESKKGRKKGETVKCHGMSYTVQKTHATYTEGEEI